MIEPQNDEERKALRLLRSAPGRTKDDFLSDLNREWWLTVLAEARAIFREEQTAKAENPRRAERLAEDELSRVRDEIRLRSEVLRAFPEPPLSQGEADEQEKQTARFLSLLDRERKLMGKEWVAG